MATQVIPENIQKSMRQRLKLLRESKKLAKTEVGAAEATTIRNWEDKDISSAKLSALFGLSQVYGMDFLDFMNYLFAAEGLNILDPGQQYYSALPEEYKVVATDMMRSLHSLSTKSKLAG